MTRIARFPFALVLLLALAAQLARAEENAEAEVLRLALHSPHERSGDYDALALSWLEALPSHAGDFRAQVIASRLTGLLPQVRDPAALVAPAEKALEAAYAHGTVRDSLASFLASLHDRAGRDAEWERVQGGRGFLRHWRIIGPFGKGAQGPFLQAFPPEEDPRLDARHRDGWQELSWRLVVRDKARPEINPADYIYPAGLAYLVSQVKSDEARDAVLERVSGGRARIWLNGVLAADDDDTSSFLETHRSTPVRLRAGWNRVLVKTEGPFAVRLASAPGTPFPAGALVEEKEDVAHPFARSTEAETLPAGRERTPPVIRAWTAWIEELAAGGADGLSQRSSPGLSQRSSPGLSQRSSPGLSQRSSPALADARMGLALLHQITRRDELAVDEATKAVALAPEDPLLLFHAGNIYRGAEYLPRTIASNRARSAFESALAKDPLLLPAYERVARFLEEDKQYVKAAIKVKEAIDRDPRFLPGLERLRSIYAAKKWRAEELGVAREIARVAPSWAGLVGNRYQALGNPVEAAAWYRQAAALQRSASWSLHGAELAAGRLDEAEAALREAVRQDPDSPRSQRTLIEFLANQGRLETALELAHRHRDRNPMDPEREAAIAELLEKAGKREEAKEAYLRALALQPGNLAVRRHLAAGMEPAPASTPTNGGDGAAGPSRPPSLDDFWAPYDEKLEEWLERIPQEGPLVAKASSILVLDIAVVRVESDGSHSEYTHQAFKLLSEESKDDLAKVDTQGEVITLRTLTPGGESLEPVPAEGRGSYVMPGLTAGALIEFSYRTHAAENRGGRFQNGPFFFQDTRFKQPVLLSRYVVLAPRGMDLGFIESFGTAAGGVGTADLARVEKTVRELDKDRVAVIYETRNSPRLEPERFMPSQEEYLPNVVVLEKESWKDVALELGYRYRWPARLTPELREAAAKVTAGIEDPIERAKALYVHVTELIPKEGRNWLAAATLIEKSGDRDILFKALCDAAGVPTRWAFLRPSEAALPRTNWSYPRAEMFPMPFVLIPRPGSEPLYVSLQNRWLPFGRLPEQIQGGRAFILDDEGPRIELLPPARPEDSAYSITATLRLGSGTDARADVAVTSQGVMFHALKDQLKTLPAFQKDLILRQMATRFFPGASVEKAEILGLEGFESPSLEVKLTAPKFLRPAKDSYLLKPILQPARLVKGFSERAVRQHPFHMRGQQVSREVVRIEPGEGYAVDRLPRGVTIAGALGNFTLAYRMDGKTVVIERELTMLAGRLSAAEFPAFIEFCEQVDAAEEESVAFRKS